jgi:hypothetical protein
MHMLQPTRSRQARVAWGSGAVRPTHNWCTIKPFAAGWRCMVTTPTEQVTFVQHGAQRFGSALDGAALGKVADAVAHLPFEKAGSRIHGDATLQRLLAGSGPVGGVARRCSVRNVGRSGPCSSTRRPPPTGRCLGIRTAPSRSRSVSTWRALVRGPSRADCCTLRRRSTYWQQW